MNTGKFKSWFRSRKLSTRCFLVAFAVTFGWSILWGAAGAIAGTDKVDSPGSTLVDLGLLIHFPNLVFMSLLCPMAPMGAGDDGSFEVMILAMIIIPSSLAYGGMSWLIGKAIETQNVP